MLITFSGLDGSGKTTLIESVRKDLEAKRYRVFMQTMYDDLCFYAIMRRARRVLSRMLGIESKPNSGPDLSKDPSFASGAEWNGGVRDPKIGAADKKGVLKKTLYGVVRSRFVKRAVLFLDLLILMIKKRRVEREGNAVLITDRYLYDSLVDVADLKGRRWGFVRMFMKLVPIPDVPIFVDVPAEVAFERKHEYPIAYNKWRRGAYLKLFGFVKDSFIIPNDDLSRSTEALRQVIAERIG